MTTWYPDTCACIVKLKKGLGPATEGDFLQQCRTHRTTLETYAHNIRFRTRDGDRKAERDKPEFQRS